MSKIVDIDILKYYNEKVNQRITDSNKVFIGTQAEYDNAYSEGRISIGTLVIILDENENTGSDVSVSSLLGTGILGKMILGNIK